MRNDRRKLLKYSAAVAGAAMAGPVMTGFIAGCEKDTVKSSDKTYEYNVASRNELASEGGAVMETLGELNSGKPVVIIRSDVSRFVVLSSVCTHQGCQVNLPNSPGGDIICACHNSKFSSTDGAVKQGPAETPLRRFASSYDPESNKLTITY